MNSGLLVAAILAFVAFHATSAYSEIDAFIFTPLEGEDVEMPEFLTRVARAAEGEKGGKGGRGMHKTCCGKKKSSHTEEEKAFAKSCKEKVSGSSDQEESFPCMMDCVARKNGIADSNGIVDEAKFSKRMQSFYDEPELKEKVKQLVTDIVKKANDEKGDGKCSLAPMKAFFKIKAKIETECPDNLKVSGEDCDKTRKWYEKFLEND